MQVPKTLQYIHFITLKTQEIQVAGRLHSWRGSSRPVPKYVITIHIPASNYLITLSILVT